MKTKILIGQIPIVELNIGVARTVVSTNGKITATLTPGEYFILVTGVAYGEGANLNVDQFCKVTVQKTS